MQKTINPVVDFGFMFSLQAKMRRSHSQNSLRGKVGAVGIAIFIFAVAWMMMPARGAEAE